MPRISPPKQERRQYIRLDSVFPVEFRLVSIDGKTYFSDWLQGFTNNVGKSGICLSVNNLEPGLAKLLAQQEAKLSLKIDIPAAENPVEAEARSVWLRSNPENPNNYTIGLNYEHIDSYQNNRIMRYARIKKYLPPLILGLVIILALAASFNSATNLKLSKANKALIQELVKVNQESLSAKEKISRINSEKESLQARTEKLRMLARAAQDKIRKLSESSNSETVKNSQKLTELNSLIKQLGIEKGLLQERLSAVERKEANVSEEIFSLNKRKAVLEKASFEKMYQWLLAHQNPRTGLVASFEGDSTLLGKAFTYDQALAAQAYNIFSDSGRAEKLLSFFTNKAKRQNGWFFNAYYADDGSPAEYTVHTGPNIWLGIAAIHYARKANDASYLSLAQEIARAVIDLQNQDIDGGIRGGPDTEWYSTEQNLDSYAFFKMAYEATNKSEYLEAGNRALNWLLKHTYDKAEPPIRRGRGDATIATDTYAWSIAAVGPEKLEELGMDPDRIMEFAEQNCAVETDFIRPEGKTVKIKGFDFAPERHLARGGVVSSEWTAQMVVAFKIMADFYHKKNLADKADSYAAKAKQYLSELTNMIISSPSPSGQGEGCLPYATKDFVDTGHGWFTPQGKSTGSVSGTAYTLFAYYDYNPLQLKD